VRNGFAKNIKALRIEDGYTQAELGKLVNVSQRKVSYWESQNIEPDIDTLLLLANFFEITVDELVRPEN
jgi:transcriptional regulator with XRE-family HTH domain